MKACVDVGGTKIAVSLTTHATGAEPAPLQARRFEPTVRTGGRDAVALQILRMLAAACRESGISEHGIEAVGVSSCGPFVLGDGLIEIAAPNICGGLAGPARGLPNDWTSALLEAPLREQFADVRIANDGVAALQAERRWGALQGFANCAYVTWSTGIGFGLCVDGHVLHGKHGNAGHAGHMFVSDNNDALCGCGNVGDLEALVAGNALPRRFPAYPDAAGVLTAAREGDAQAAAIIDDVCRIMGRALYNLIVTLDLQRISLGGGVFWNQRDYLLPRLRSSISGKLPALTDACALVPAGLQDQVGNYAALALVL
ncbi:MAG: ROK family protein [Polaromonas sp.]|nr:ROK family protein [Polaromonas sp.]